MIRSHIEGYATDVNEKGGARLTFYPVFARLISGDPCEIRWWGKRCRPDVLRQLAIVRVDGFGTRFRDAIRARFVAFSGVPQGAFVAETAAAASWEVVPILDAARLLLDVPGTMSPLAMMSAYYSAQCAEPDALNVALDMLASRAPRHVPAVIAKRRREQQSTLFGDRVPRPRIKHIHERWRYTPPRERAGAAA